MEETEEMFVSDPIPGAEETYQEPATVKFEQPIQTRKPNIDAPV